MAIAINTAAIETTETDAKMVAQTSITMVIILPYQTVLMIAFDLRPTTHTNVAAFVVTRNSIPRFRKHSAARMILPNGVSTFSIPPNLSTARRIA